MPKLKLRQTKKTKKQQQTKTFRSRKEQYDLKKNEAEQRAVRKNVKKYNFKKIAITCAAAIAVMILLLQTISVRIFEHNEQLKAELETLQAQLEIQIQKNTELTSIDNLIQYQNNMEIRDNIYSLEELAPEE